MQCKAAASQRVEWTSRTPIQSQKPARFAGSRTSYHCAFDDHDTNAAPSQEVCGASSDHTTAANYNTHSLLRKFSE